jgi:hypothetical protein
MALSRRVNHPEPTGRINLPFEQPCVKTPPPKKNSFTTSRKSQKFTFVNFYAVFAQVQQTVWFFIMNFVLLGLLSG